RIIGVADRHDLDGDHAIEEGILGAIDDAHATPADDIENVVFPNLLGYRCSHVFSLRSVAWGIRRENPDFAACILVRSFVKPKRNRSDRHSSSEMASCARR